MATLTLRNVPDDLVARLKARAKRHRRSLNNETIAALELADAAANGAGPMPAAALPAPVDQGASLARIREIQARFAGAHHALPDSRTPEQIHAQLDRFAELRSRFKGHPLTSEEIIAAIERESHPPEREPFTQKESHP